MLTAKGNVDYAVGAANAALDPDCERREDEGDDVQEDIGATHGRGGGRLLCVPVE